MTTRLQRTVTVALVFFAASLSADAAGFFGRNRNCCTSPPICYVDAPQQVWALYICCEGTYQYRASSYDSDKLKEYAMSLGCTSVTFDGDTSPSSEVIFAKASDSVSTPGGTCICVVAKLGAYDNKSCPVPIKK